MRSKLKKLVNQRLTMESLKKKLLKLSDFYEVSKTPVEDLLSTEDLRLDIADTNGIGSIWYLRTRTDDLYITEIANSEDKSSS